MTHFATLLLSLLLCSPLLAQAPAPLPRPNLDLWSGGIVYAMAATADGGRIIGGEFTAVGGLPRQNLARLLADGSVDPAWSADVNGPVRVLAVDAAGRIYVAGSFTQLAGISRSRLGRLNAGGQADAGWDPAPAGGGIGVTLSSLLVAGPHVYVAGDFSQIGGQFRSGLARFGVSDGALDLSWNPPGSGGSVTQLVADSGHLYAATAAADGYPLRRYPLAGPASPDPQWSPFINGGVTAVALDGSGALYLAGEFDFVQSAPRTGLARLATASGATLDLQWAPEALGWVGSLQFLGAHLYIAGRFRASSTQPYRHFARYAANGGGVPDPVFAPSAGGGAPLVLLPGAGDMLHAGGRFTSITGHLRPGLATLSTLSGLPTAVATAAELKRPLVHALLRQADGGLLVGGRFTRVDAQPRLNLLRLGPDGLPDPQWRVDVDGPPVAYRTASGDSPFDFDPLVRALAEDASGRVYVGGVFAFAGGHPRANLARMSAAGSVDVDWNPGADGSVSDLLPDNLGNVYAAGNFTTIAGAPRVSLAMLSDAPGSAIDPQWQADLDLGSIAVQLLLDGEGSLFVAGNGFGSVNGVQCCLGLAKLAAGGSGSLDPQWSVKLLGSGRRADAIALHGGHLYIAGRFDALFQDGASHARNSLARVDPDGTGSVDALWDPGAGSASTLEFSALAVDSGSVYASPYYHANRVVSTYSTVGAGAADPEWRIEGANYVYTLLLSHGTLYAGGDLTTVNGEARSGLAAVQTDGLLATGFE